MKLFLLVIFTFFYLQTNAQTCTGSLGDPVINQNFGSGANPGPPLASGVTTLTYTATNCPNDGEYTISNNISGANNCHNTWQNVISDHTGNPNGYMMIVNASYQPSIFFTQTASGLCPNTTYEFSSYILNLITLAASGPDVSEPNITFSIATASGQILAMDSTGTIPSTDGPTWNKYGTYFTTPANVTDVVVTMTNKAPGGNGNDLILDDITFRACGPIIQTGFSSINGPGKKELCQGSNAAYIIKASVVGNNNPAYQWQQNNSNAGWTDIVGETTASLNINILNAVIGTYQYRLGVANGSNISSVQCRVYSPPSIIDVTPLPVVPAIAAQTVCEGNMLQLTASGGAGYQWSGPNMAASTQNPLIINNVSQANAGIYMVVALSDSGCAAAPVQVMVKVVPKVLPMISSNEAICTGQKTQLSASGGLRYKWRPSAGLDNDTIPNPVASPMLTTTYRVDISNGGCSDSTKSVTVTVNKNPVANAGGDKIIFEGQSVKLDGTIAGDNITGFNWEPTIDLNNASSLTPIASPTDDITYTLTVISASCGTAASKVFVRVYKKITVPNTFTPNNDGINDYWNIDALVTYPQSLISVYDRYGQKVYQSTGYPKPWDGKYKGVPLPQGTYYYVIDLKDDKPKIVGWLLILR